MTERFNPNTQWPGVPEHSIEERKIIPPPPQRKRNSRDKRWLAVAVIALLLLFLIAYGIYAISHHPGATVVQTPPAVVMVVTETKAKEEKRAEAARLAVEAERLAAKAAEDRPTAITAAISMENEAEPSSPDIVVLQDGEKGGVWRELTVKGVKLVFRWCPAGTFMMGSPEDELGRSQNPFIDETRHEVTLTHGFWMLETQVTQEMWEVVMDRKPSYFKDNGKRPVEQVSWDDCQDYIKKLNALGVAPTGYRFSLPTESQWEYACRAGTTTALNSGKNLSCTYGYCPNLTVVGWYGQHEEDSTHEVGLKTANAWGLRDMHGNVWEWCLDWYGDYPSGSVTDPTGPSLVGSYRVFRGGSWHDAVGDCRSASRRSGVPTDRHYYLGLRLALVRE